MTQVDIGNRVGDGGPLKPGRAAAMRRAKTVEQAGLGEHDSVVVRGHESSLGRSWLARAQPCRSTGIVLCRIACRSGAAKISSTGSVLCKSAGRLTDLAPSGTTGNILVLEQRKHVDMKMGFGKIWSGSTNSLQLAGAKRQRLPWQWRMGGAAAARC